MSDPYAREYDRGYYDGVLEYTPGERTGDPVGEQNDYILGFWCGIGQARAFSEGYEAARNGIITCPY